MYWYNFYREHEYLPTYLPQETILQDKTDMFG